MSGLVEINFDGIIGPTHNYAGLSLGNLAATFSRGAVSRPRAAALQGIDKMRRLLSLGQAQAVLPPQARPDRHWLAALATRPETADPALIANALSASAMWAANAATVSPSPDSGDGRCHLTIANLVTMAHRSHEWPETLRQLRLAFADSRHFAVHGPVPPPFGDEGAANHMRLTARHDAPGIEIFVYGRAGGPFPARQHPEACRAVARRHGLSADRTLFVEQSAAVIAAGAFHNDVVAVANGRVLLAHEQAFAMREAVHADLCRLMPEVEIVEVPAAAVSLADAIRSYLFNAQLVTMADGSMTLVVPVEARETPAVSRWLDGLPSGGGPIRRIEVVDIRQSMANGGGPACLRLRVVADPATVDSRFLVDEARLDRLTEVIAVYWPEAIRPEDLGEPALWRQADRARLALLEVLGLGELAFPDDGPNLF